MHIVVTFSRFALTALSTLCVSALVGNLPAGAADSARPPFVRGAAAPQAAPSSVIVVGSPADQAVEVFTPSGAPIASISTLYQPQGVALDRSGNVYIAGQGRNALVYKNDYKTLLLTLTDSQKFPYSIAV